MSGSGGVFLDHAAATPLRPEVTEAMARAATDAWANPSSQHAAGRRARRVLEDSRDHILTLVGGGGTGSGRDRLVFSSGMTEANRLALLGMATGRTGCVASSARDHSSLRAAVRELGERGWQVVEPPLDAGGAIDPGWTSAVPEQVPAILCLTIVCGQTGTIDRGDRGAWRERSLLVHADVAQAVLCHPVSFADSGFATLALAPCKFGGPRGIAATIVRAGIPFTGIVPGPQEGGLRGGTEAVVLAVGFAKALDLVVAERQALVERLSRLRERFESRLVDRARAAGIPATVVAAAGDRAANLLVVAFPGIDRQVFVMAADLEGVECASGAACASGSTEPAPAIAALRVGPESAQSAVRFSFGAGTTVEEIDLALSRLERVFGRLSAAPRP